MYYNVLASIGLFYYTLGNIDPKFRSTIHTIQLVAVVRTVLIEKYGIKKILQPFVDEIKLLESVSITMCNDQTTLEETNVGMLVLNFLNW